MQETIHEIDDILVPAVFHNQNLIDNQILLGLKFQIHLLDRNTSVGAVLVCCIDTSRCTLSDFVKAPVFAGRITGSTY